MKRTPIIAVIGLALAAASAPASAAMPCAPRDQLRADLAARYGETPVARGVVGDRHVFEVYAAPTGSFTVVVTRPDGLSCVMAAGDGWQAVAPPPADDGDDA